MGKSKEVIVVKCILSDSLQSVRIHNKTKTIDYTTMVGGDFLSTMAGEKIKFFDAKKVENGKVQLIDSIGKQKW